MSRQTIHAETAQRSSYRIEDGGLVRTRSDLGEPAALAVLIHSQFRATILSPAFPCLGGAGAVRRGDYRFAVYDRLGSPEAIAACADDLVQFTQETPAGAHPVAVFVAAFDGPIIPTEEGFETALWEQLRGIHECDSGRDLDGRAGGVHRPLSETEKDDPGFVFCDREFFVVGLHPASSRWARRFAWPTLVFNALTHSEELQRAGKYGRMQEKTLARDLRLQGTENPSLPFSQVAQFSGRKVDADWECPVELE